MKRTTILKTLLGAVLAAASGSAGYWMARSHGAPSAAAPQQATKERTVLYWYDPMAPDQHFPAPGKSPFMDMELVPKYADEVNAASGVAIDPAMVQALGIRVAPVVRGALGNALSATAALQFNERQVAVVQAWTSGFVERTHARAPGDVVARGAPLVDLLVPDWTGAQHEFLALLGTGDAALIGAGRERLRLLGMPPDLIAQVEQSKAPHPVLTVRAPFAGVIESLDVREGMTVASGTTLAKLKGLETVWLEAAVPEAQASDVKVGEAVTATFTAYPGETFKGRVVTVLPEMNSEARTVRVRVELPNREGRLKPGMYAAFHGATLLPAPVLQVPSEAVIRSGTRNVVLLALQGGRYQPVEVKLGQEADGKVAVLQGLAEGQQVVVSGQFLIDSEASLQGVMTRSSQP
ncbi:MAG: efflux RND transporter periplasmic adaptor subunit [Betaproteobacteria bacterium]|nr:efflux RND transporter periplasmic adaptor subunit [Betaproteobacteria bacterium]MDE1988858.1 efflux RND transporter periplasmic adaptor subunit [Betaproteobacteria bacterium]